MKHNLFAILTIVLLNSCGNGNQNSLIPNFLTEKKNGNSQMLTMLDSLSKGEGIDLKNFALIKSYYQTTSKNVFTDGNKIATCAINLKKFIDQDSKYYGLFAPSYHQKEINQLVNNIDQKKDDLTIAKTELYCTDAWMQLVKHLKNGRLYNDSNKVHLDTTLCKQVLFPAMDRLLTSPDSLAQIAQSFEPKMHDYDTLKSFLKTAIDNPAALNNTFTKVIYPQKDSLQMVLSVMSRLKEEGIGVQISRNPDSSELATLVKSYQENHDLTPSGKIDAGLINVLNKESSYSFKRVALTLDKFKNLKVPHKGNYVLVNIPSFVLRGYNADGSAVESKVAVGKLASRTPIMESEISDIIIMPKWFVPPSILKLPGYIDRKRRNPNYIVRGNTVIQKSGPGNALGEMKFNFKSGNAIYLHDTNEKWAFGSSKRAVSHGCVRVQKYKELASFLTTLTPLVEYTYKKVEDKIKVDSISNDTTRTYKYVVKDSVVHKGDAVPGMVKYKSHMELTLQNKVPIYIKYMTCAIRNGKLVTYNDVYGIDKGLEEKYFGGM